MSPVCVYAAQGMKTAQADRRVFVGPNAFLLSRRLLLLSNFSFSCCFLAMRKDCNPKGCKDEHCLLVSEAALAKQGLPKQCGSHAACLVFIPWLAGALLGQWDQR